MDSSSQNPHDIMETPAPFNLNHAIEGWREKLVHSPVFRDGNLDELESHLSDSIEDLQSRGLTEEEAFMVAIKRLGTADALAAEFKKINPHAIWFERLVWMLIGLQAWELVLRCIQAVANGAVLFAISEGGFDFAAHGVALPTVFFASANLLAVAGSLALCWWLLTSKRPRVSLQIARLGRSQPAFAMTCLGAVLISLLVLAGSQMVPGLFFMNLHHQPHVAQSWSYGRSYAEFIRVAVFVVAALCLLRKRHQLRRA
ncbi:MAG: hypothetical protein JWL59_908 [Chthoniobacteraceae bacterium]|nr:hypothetical protein [Chthoniobacteraceae bacterium]